MRRCFCVADLWSQRKTRYAVREEEEKNRETASKGECEDKKPSWPLSREREGGERRGRLLGPLRDKGVSTEDKEWGGQLG